MEKIVKLLLIRLDSAMEWVLKENGKLLLSGREEPFPPCDECELIAPSSRVLLLRAELPKANRKRLSEIAAFAIEESVISDPERNHVVAGPQFSDGKTLLAVVDKAWMRSQLERIGKAGIRPKKMMAESLMVPLLPESWALVMEETGGFLKTGEYAAYCLDSSGLEPPLALRLALQEEKPEKIVVHARTCPDPGKWGDLLGASFVKGEEWNWKASETATSFDLLSGEFAAKGEKIDWKPYRPVLLMLLSALFLQFSGIVYDWIHLSLEKRAMLSEMEHVFRKSFPEARVIVDAPLQMQRKLDEMKQQGNSGFIQQLASISPQISALPPGSLSAIDYSKEGIDLSIDFPSMDALNAFRMKLDQSGIHTEEKKRESRGQVVSVRLRIASGTT